jgi:hypothetical protein
MSTATTTALAATLSPLAQAAGLSLTEIGPGTDFAGRPTARFTLALAADAAKSQSLELSEAFDPAAHIAALTTYFTNAARRLEDPAPAAALTLLGPPLTFASFQWPFHPSTSGADTFIVHGEIALADGNDTGLHAKVSASLTRTFAEVVPALEQPYAEDFIYNAVRKTMDQGQLELVKSGNRQPVPVTTRYYSAKQGKFIFNDTTDAQRSEFLAAKVYWLSGKLGGSAPVWIADPRDAQYLNTTVGELKSAAAKLESGGLLQLTANGESATPCPELLSRHSQYEVEVQEALQFLKPSFNEEMRAGHTNM